MLSNTAIKRPIATAMILLMIVVIGVFSFINIPQDLFPSIEFPVAVVITSYSNAGPEEVENLITKPLEGVLASVENLDQLVSITMQGQSIIVIQFHMDTDMNFATLNMRERIALVSSYLPSSAGDPMVIKMDMNSMPVVQVYVSGDMPVTQLFNEVENNFLTYFERIKGVATVSVTGGVSEEITLAVNPEKMAGYGLTLSQIAQMLAAENINLPSGNVTRGSTEVIVRTMGEFKSIDDIKNLPIPLRDRSIVRLDEIATITQHYKDPDSITRMNGNNAIGLMITKQSDANTVDVSNRVRGVVDSLGEQFPEFQFRVGMDQAEYIKRSLSSVARAAIIGGILAIFVVFMFLRNFRTTLVIAISIPVSLLATFALMSFRGMTLNLITMAALALSVGILIDTSIIVLENIFRTRQFVDDPQEAARKGTREVFVAVIAACLTTVVVFLPIAMASGLASLMFSDFSFTMVIALLVSLVVSLTAVPMLCSKLLTRGVSMNYLRFGSYRYKFRLIPKFTVFIEFLTRSYETIIRASLKKRKRVIISCTLIFFISIGLVGVVGTELLPSTDESSFSINVDLPYGTSLADKNAYITEIEEYVMTIPEIRHCTLRAGSGGGMFSLNDSSASIRVSLVPLGERARGTEDVVNEVKEKLSLKTGADISVAASSTMSMMLGSVDMAVYIKGSDLKTLERVANEIRDKVAALPEVKEASVDITEGNPEVSVLIDRNVASYYGITAAQLANGLSSALSGTTATKLKIAGEEIDVKLSLPDSYSHSIDNMKQIMITGATGLSVPVGQIAELKFNNAPNLINRMDQQRYITLNISINSQDLGSAAAKIDSIVDSYPFPEGYYYETAGMQEEMLDAFGSLFQALLIAIALVYLVLAAQFESLVQPFIVATAIPFAMSGAFLALFITGTKLSLTSFLGLIMLVGIVINSSILLVTFITQYRNSLGRDEAIVQAGKIRLRPILMMTFTTCAAMTPIAIGIGEGSELLAPMGIAIIGGLIASTLITLIFVPVLYSVIDDGKEKRALKKQKRLEWISALEAKWLLEDSKNA